MDDKNTLHFHFSCLHLSNIFSQLIENQVSLVRVEVFIVKDGNYPTATFNEQGSRISELSLLGFPVLEFQRSRSRFRKWRTHILLVQIRVRDIGLRFNILYTSWSLFISHAWILYDINNSLYHIYVPNGPLCDCFWFRFHN